MYVELWHRLFVPREPCLPAPPTLKLPKSLRTLGSYSFINTLCP